MKYLRPKFFAVALSLITAMPVALPAHEGEEVPENARLTILDAVAGGPAEAAGFESGDRLLEFAGEVVETLDDLSEAMARHEPGDRVPVTVERNRQQLALSLTLGEREGGVSLGVSLAVMSPEGAAEFLEAQRNGLDSEGCLDWVDETYRFSSVAASLGFDLGDQAESLRACMRKDLTQMPGRIPQRWCDNVFKVHCSGLDLLTAMGEAQVSWCESVLEESLGVDLGETPAWTTCAENRLFEKFSIRGEASDAADCRAALDDCGFTASANAAL